VNLISKLKLNAKVPVTVVRMALSWQGTIKNTSSSVQIANLATFHNHPAVAAFFDDGNTKVSYFRQRTCKTVSPQLPRILANYSIYNPIAISCRSLSRN